MGKKELKKIIDKSMSSGEFRITYDDAAQNAQKELAFLSRHLGSLSESDLPFYYSKLNRDVLIVDHVPFNSKKNLTKQVDNLLELFLAQRSFIKPQAKLAGRFKMLPPISKGPNTARNYLANCALEFGECYKRLAEYKNTLEKEGVIRPGSRVKTCFFLEDITPLGSYIVSSSGMQELVLLYVKQFLDLFERSDQLDYVFYGCFTGCSDALWFMGRDDIDFYRKNEMDLIRKKYFAFDVEKYGSLY